MTEETNSAPMKVCDSCRQLNEIDTRYCSVCAGANFTPQQSVAAAPEISITPTKSRIADYTRSDKYLSAIALYLKVFWQFFLGSLVSSITMLIGFLTISKSVSCEIDYYDYSSSCSNSTNGFAVFIMIVGGLVALGLFIAAVINGFTATSRIREAENS